MEQLLFYHSKIVTISLILCAALATIGTMMVVRKLLFMSGTTFRQFLELRFRPSALRCTEQFERLLSEYQEIADILAQYTPDYSIVFSEANWTRLILALDQLNAAHVELCELLNKGESKDAMCLAEFLSSGGEPLAKWKYGHINDEWEGLADWERELHHIVCQVIQTLTQAVIQARKLGISRGASAEETLALLERLRALM
jgi:hypothetical protein